MSLTQQLFLTLREKILSQQLLVGSRLPASRILAKDLGVSRNTVNSVYEQLRAEGYVNSREGSGFYISEQLPQFDRSPHIAKGKPVQDWPPLSDYGHQLLKRSGGHGSKPKDIANLPFSVGLPDFQAFPIKIWQQLIRRHSDRPVLMGYHSYQGYAPLRNALADYLNVSRGLKCRPEQIVITQGAQQGLALCAQLLMNPGDTALVEEPGYSGARKALISNGINLQAVTHGDNGINIGALSEGEYRLLCCTPTHQYPMGGILTASERLQLLQWAERNRCWIVEDDYDSEFHYYSQPIAAMAGMAERTPVIYMGSFSKTLLPGLRLGYLVVPEHLVGVFVEAKAFSGGETPLLTQAVVADFIEEGHFYRHLRRSRKLYQQKWEHMQRLCEKHLAGIMTPVAQSAGMHLALVFNHQQVDDRKVCQEFAMKGFGGSPLSSYYHSSRSQKGLVLGFANTSEGERVKGIKTLSQLL
ncbi:hypothetical protein GV64_16095 [Endozoicomonas elysicola]|uniref:HTH gntR-type domain-containing protein n=1 Tax=Endozoicomonas elysicola TaxID=305900 RepID=A0A081KD15_9GAMM|nr:hypothetical protein GV64_16095 [Endozoicomonas elysicola]